LILQVAAVQFYSEYPGEDLLGSTPAPGVAERASRSAVARAELARTLTTLPRAPEFSTKARKMAAWRGGALQSARRYYGCLVS
jgi:hypothetical protein